MRNRAWRTAPPRAADACRNLRRPQFVGVPQIEQLRVFGAQLVHADGQCRPDSRPAFQRLRDLGGHRFDQLFVERQPILLVTFSLRQQLKASNRIGPGAKIRAGLELIPLAPQDAVGLLQHIVGVGGMWEQCQDVGVQVALYFGDLHHEVGGLGFGRCGLFNPRAEIPCEHSADGFFDARHPVLSGYRRYYREIVANVRLLGANSG